MAADAIPDSGPPGRSGGAGKTSGRADVPNTAVQPVNKGLGGRHLAGIETDIGPLTDDEIERLLVAVDVVTRARTAVETTTRAT